MKYIIKFDDNWADEMDISGFLVCNEIYMTKIENLKSYKEEIYFNIGTNQELYYENGKSFFEKLSITKISEPEFDILNKLFGYNKDLIEDLIDRAILLKSEEEIREFDTNEEKWVDFENEIRNLSTSKIREIYEKTEDIYWKKELYLQYMMDKGEEEEWLEDINEIIKFVDSLDEESLEKYKNKPISKENVLSYGFGYIIKYVLEQII